MGEQNHWLRCHKWHSRSTNKGQVMQHIVTTCPSACPLSLTSELKCSGAGTVSSLHTCPATNTTASLCFMPQTLDMAPLIQPLVHQNTKAHPCQNTKGSGGKHVVWLEQNKINTSAQLDRFKLSPTTPKDRKPHGWPEARSSFWPALELQSTLNTESHHLAVTEQRKTKTPKVLNRAFLKWISCIDSFSSDKDITSATYCLISSQVELMSIYLTTKSQEIFFTIRKKNALQS